jgi:hypothetical protein
VTCPQAARSRRAVASSGARIRPVASSGAHIPPGGNRRWVARWRPPVPERARAPPRGTRRGPRPTSNGGETIGHASGVLSSRASVSIVYPNGKFCLSIQGAPRRRKSPNSRGSRLTGRKRTTMLIWNLLHGTTRRAILFPTRTHKGTATGRWMCTPASREARCGHTQWFPPYESRVREFFPTGRSGRFKFFTNSGDLNSGTLGGFRTPDRRAFGGEARLRPSVGSL